EGLEELSFGPRGQTGAEVPDLEDQGVTRTPYRQPRRLVRRRLNGILQNVDESVPQPASVQRPFRRGPDRIDDDAVRSDFVRGIQREIEGRCYLTVDGAG